MNTKNAVFTLLYTAILSVATISPIALASSDSALAITGNVLASPCIIAPDTVKGDVDLGEVFSSRLHNAGDSADWAAFSLNLTDCPATTTKVVVHFTGTPDPDYPVFFTNTGSSEHVAIEVADATGVRVSNNSVRDLSVNSQHQAKMDLKGRVTSPQGEATSGTVAGIMEVSFDFQ